MDKNNCNIVAVDRSRLSRTLSSDERVAISRLPTVSHSLSS